MIYVGIDLGTNNCCISYIDNNGKLNIVKQPHINEYLIPSVVHISNSNILVGSIAFKQFNYISNFKRLIGHSINDPEIIQLVSKLGYTVEEKEGMLYIESNNCNVSIINIITILLKHLKEIIDNVLKEEWSCIITIPAYFNEIQRNITWQSILLAEIPCLKMLNEPTSACIYYLYENKQNNINNILVVDFGAGTLDLSIIQVDNVDETICEVKSIYGNNNLGGIDITQVISDNFNISMQEAELIKIKLSYDKEFNNYTRNDINLLLDTYFKTKIINAIDEVLKRANMLHQDIDDIILVGGSSKIPWLKTLITDYMKKNIKQNNFIINSEIFNFEDVAVSLGAALHRYHLSNNSKDLILIDRLPLSIGIRTQQNMFVPIIPQNSIIPVTVTKKFTTEEDNQTDISIDIFQGESILINENILIESFKLSGIKPAPKQQPVIYITIKVNSNGIIEVIAKERHSDISANIKIDNTKYKINDKVINDIISGYEKNKEYNRLLQSILEKFYTLLDMVNKISFHINENIILDLSKEIKNKIHTNICDIIYDLLKIKFYTTELTIDLTLLHKLCNINNISIEIDLNNKKDEITYIHILEKWIECCKNEYGIYLIQNLNNDNSIELIKLITSLKDNIITLPINDDGKTDLLHYLNFMEFNNEIDNITKIEQINTYSEFIYNKYKLNNI